MRYDKGGGSDDDKKSDLEEEWKMKYDITNGKFYYHHVGSGQTQWERPVRSEKFDKLLLAEGV